MVSEDEYAAGLASVAPAENKRLRIVLNQNNVRDDLGPIVQGYLAENGPCTTREIADALGVPSDRIRTTGYIKRGFMRRVGFVQIGRNRLRLWAAGEADV